jgi:predicted metal-dependent phosphoesterase TrpH
MSDPWTREGTWLRCALHAHTTRSDGELSPRHLAGQVVHAGYDVLAITDYWRITGDESVDGLTVIPSDGLVVVEVTDAAGRKACANPFTI